MKKLIVILYLFSIVASCKSQDANEDYIGTWVEVQQKNNEYVFLDCGYKGGSIKIDTDSISEKGVMEDVDLKINHIKQDESGVCLFTAKSEKSYYKFSWIDKERGISKWEIKKSEGSKIIKYFVSKSHLKNIITVKGTNLNCITNDDIGDKINDSLVISSDGTKLLVEDDNCISIEDKKGVLIFERCFDNCNVKIRHIKTKDLPLTIISGQNSIDIDFYKKGLDWISTSVTYFKSLPTGEEKRTKQIEVSLKGFDFDSVIEQFGEIKNNDLSSLDDIKNKEKLIELDIYKIADILKNNPVSESNVTLYNDAAFTLIEKENFNEARIILLDVINFSPDRVVAYLNLGDAQWGFNENDNAKKSYQKYLSLMKSQNKDLNKVPKRVYERTK